ncbi:MAG: hypothetical protein M3N18_09995 [Actinomycetota bacterium]|nr:hypothetical protein [Actinomycetota bacterium]
MPQCAGIKRDGGRCAVVVGAGWSHCYQHDPDRSDERKRNASRGGRSKGAGELAALKKQARDLAADVLTGKVETPRAAVANQIYNTLIRAIEQERKNLEMGELAERLEAMEEVLKGRRTG